MDQGADFMCRHKTGMIDLNPETQLPMNLSALLKLRGNLDLEVLMNDKSRTCIRHLAVPFATEIANRYCKFEHVFWLKHRRRRYTGNHRP